MANSINPVDVYALLNEIVEQATGQKSIDTIDTTNFSSVGETLLRTAPENTLNAISTVIAKTIFSVRPYKGKLDILRVGQERWGAMTRKIVYLYKEAEKSNDWNTDIDAVQLADGNSIDHYKINKPEVMQLNFYGTKVLQKHITRFRDQLSLAFHNESEFMNFMDGVMTEFFNEVELINENNARLTLANFILGSHKMDINTVDLVAEYNEVNDTTLTREELLSNAHITDFAKFVASSVLTWSSRLSDMTALYHANIDGHAPLLRHTPKEKQKMIMYAPYFNTISTEVYSSIFNPEYLNLGDMETVNYWQSPINPTMVKGKPNYLNTTTGESVSANSLESIDYVLGLLYDVDALGIIPQFDYASTTDMNSAGGYWNTYYHWRFCSYSDYSENHVLFILGDGGEVTGD